MWCKNCNIETNEDICPICGETTVEDLPIEIYWCKHCNTPIIQFTNQADKGTCPICRQRTKYLTTDLRPVFPEERLLLEILLDKKPNEFVNSSVWSVNSRYYIDGKSISIPSGLFQTADTDAISVKLKEYESGNTYEYFNEHIKTFIAANRNRLNYLKDESFDFVRKTASKFDEERLVISFSGGKD